MIRYTLSAAIAVLLAVAVPVSAQVYDTFVIPVIGNTAGAGGTVWGTELALFNPQPHTLFISATFLPSGLGQGSEVLIEVPSNQTFAVGNALFDLYKRSGTGSLLLATFVEDNPHVPDPTIVDLSFVVQSRTFNNAPSGTYGQGIPGVIAGMMDFPTEELSAVATGVNNFGAISLSGFRANVGALNLGRFEIRMLVNVYDELGRTIAQNLEFKVPPLGHFQDPLPVAVTRGTVEFFVFDPGANDPQNFAVVFPYVSVVDNRSGDGTYLNPVLLASPGYLYGKQAKGLSTTEVGKKLDKEIAKRARDRSELLGNVRLVPDANGTMTLERDF
jgi:hypothetical protein